MMKQFKEVQKPFVCYKSLLVMYPFLLSSTHPFSFIQFIQKIITTITTVVIPSYLICIIHPYPTLR
ncbi:uncharacterized protein BX664DRAFT_330605 [Halteromyces radiatus]|uniref:uncharacterized protein n=1 Tax=Halteromyces radiatus TaxID=101107 RepID=UPI00221EDAA9|nr:uncharacterized protein BX664DRAFT_342134 [Halteromyces radiatus]XP_051398472.1 uncharacterized protein BX664DRAFT_338433 [Halteromyces radiatus]XP_051401844.1 uncharacterized protein BX664DRAFT_329608 [Halteromyces radiatus]XP_051402249.1 uncharacterized protein BX664DRAFT_330605 [Halteromyces radiatus]KAI8080034.1 hypothetical protein BX664DRAFT_342134 [Halteromyces radiatus]KAI8085057.1 hypothetical protein BX664DRAFT_338433 [Halteromyces radiatus]KAI8093393.1 hypothetical protein BX664